MKRRGPQRRAVDPTTGRLYRIIGKPARLSAPPVPLRRATLDNLALVPGSLLPFKKEWQKLANQLPEGSTLVILPTSSTPQRKALEGTVSQLRGKGRPVRVVLATRFAADRCFDRLET